MLAWLFTPGLLARLRDNETRVAKPSDTLTMADLFSSMSGAIFAEGTPKEIGANSDVRAVYLGQAAHG